MIWNLLGNRKAKSRKHAPKQVIAGLESLEDRLLMTGLDTLGISAATAIVTDTQGNTVGDLDADTTRAMASTTKMMTALLAVENAASLDDIVPIGFYPTVVEGSSSQPTQGEQFTLREALRMSLMRSDNEVTQAIAEYVVGQTSTDVQSGVEINFEFTEMMNQRAAELGLTNTNYRNPHGRDPYNLLELGTAPGENDGHYSSARDLATLGNFVMQHPEIAEIVGTSSATVTSTRADGTTRTYNIGNGNGLVTNVMPYPGANGVKGGMTRNAGYVLVSQATILGRTLNGVVMDSDAFVDSDTGIPNENNRNTDSHAILNYGFEEKYGFVVDSINFTVDTRTGRYDFNSEIFSINGTDQADTITVRRFANDMQITVNGVSEWLPIDDFSEIRVDSGAGNDWITITGTPESLPIDVNAGADNDVVIIGSGVGLNIVDDYITVDGGTGDDDLRLYDYGTIGGQSYGFTESSIVRSNMPELAYSNIDEIIVYGTNYNDVFSIDGLSTSVDLRIYAGYGSDRLEGADRNQTWYVTGDNSGSVGNVTFSQLENLKGGTAADTFRLSNQRGVSGEINGGSGRDTLSYSYYTTGVVVDLQSGDATNVDGGVTSIENVTGGRSSDILLGNSKNNVLSGYRGNDILVGRDGNDTLINSSGRSIMIGGAGSDVMYGGSGQDLMIGGTTAYDDNRDDLEAMMDVWGDKSLDYSDRVSALRTGIWSGKKKIALNSLTVFDDRAVDSVFGSGDLDWFWLFKGDSSDRSRSELCN